MWTQIPLPFAVSPRTGLLHGSVLLHCAELHELPGSGLRCGARGVAESFGSSAGTGGIA